MYETPNDIQTRSRLHPRKKIAYYQLLDRVFVDLLLLLNYIENITKEKSIFFLYIETAWML